MQKGRALTRTLQKQAGRGEAAEIGRATCVRTVFLRIYNAPSGTDRSVCL